MRGGVWAANQVSRRWRRTSNGRGRTSSGAVEEDVVEADADGEVLLHLRAGGFAVEALLEVGEGGDLAVADDEEFAVDHRLEIHGVEDFGEGRGDVVGAAGVDAFAERRGDELDADAVPFPFGAEEDRVEGGDVGGFEGLGEHEGAEDGLAGRVGLGAVAFEPGEERGVGRG